MSDEDLEVLSLGTVVGGSRPDNRAWLDAVNAISSRVIANRTDVDSPLAVNVVYYIPGEHFQPDFQGVRTGRSTRNPPALLVQVGLPQPLPNDAEQRILDLLSEAVDVADDYARRKRIVGEEGLRGLETLVHQLASK